MRCLYSVPAEAAAEVNAGSRDYAAALSAWTPEAISAGDRLTALIERAGGGRLCLEGPDWDTISDRLSGGSDSAVLAEIFWGPKDVGRIANAVRALEPPEASAEKTLEAWLRSEAARGRSVLILAK